jgi:hypothetical protein
VSRSEGDGAAESVYYSVASRIANLLDLANKPAANAIEREVNIRGILGHCVIGLKIVANWNSMVDLVEDRYLVFGECWTSKTNGTQGPCSFAY